MRSALTFGLLSLLLLTRDVGAQGIPDLRDADRIRLAEAFRLAGSVQNEVWDEWSEAPFAVLLVTPDWEYLIHHPAPSSDFSPIGFDRRLGVDVFARPRVFAPTLQATFPAVGGVPTVVIGTAEGTRSASTRWVLTLLHEHFHQYQTSQDGYYAGVTALDLAGGDETGMWMLNFPFPYDNPAVARRFNEYRDALAAAVAAIGTDAFPERVAALTTARRQFRRGLDARDLRYFDFQLWQEGTARYTEHRVAALASGQDYAPSPAFLELPDATPYRTAAADLRADLTRGLAEASLSEWERGAFYTIGAAEGMVLDAVQPGWHRRYVTEPFGLNPYLTAR